MRQGLATAVAFTHKVAEHTMTKLFQAGRVDRRTTLKLIGTAVPFVALASTSAQASKMSQKAVRYQDDPKNGKDCAGCKVFEPPHGCKLVEGNISPKGWCMIWQAK
jgi:hypothetical protein